MGTFKSYRTHDTGMQRVISCNTSHGSSPTTPRRAAGMLESPTLQETLSPRLSHTLVPGEALQTPSLLSRLFSWGSPQTKDTV